MNYQDMYQQYYRQVPSDIEKYKSNTGRFVIGYTSDLDVVVRYDAEVFGEILSAYLKEAPSLKKNDVIDSMEAFARIVSYYMIHGLGGEIDISSLQVCEYIERRFESEFALGGTGAQEAAALGAIGFPAIVHITDRSKEVSRRMDGVGLKVVTKDGVVPIMEGAADVLPVRHIIFQYSKGEKLVINGTEYEVPVSNRLIIDYDRIHKYLPIDTEFLDYCEANAKDLLAYSVSGFNGIVDADIMEKKSDELVTHYKRVKERNPACMIYLEGAHYLNPRVKDLVFEKMAGYVDILGMNEEELVEHTRKFGMNTDKDDLASVLNGLALMISKYPVTGIVMHTKDYSMYYGKQIDGVDLEKGLTLGNLMSGTRARTGRYGSYEDCRDTLCLPLSEVGVSFAERLADIDMKECVYIVPSRYMEHPRYTIGLGDTFVAGFLISFVK